MRQYRLILQNSTLCGIEALQRGAVAINQRFREGRAQQGYGRAKLSRKQPRGSPSHCRLRLAQVDPHHIADISPAASVTRNHQANRASIHCVAIPAIGQEHLLAFILRIDLSKRQRSCVAVAPCHHNGLANPRPSIGSQHSCVFEYRPKQRALVGNCLGAAVAFEQHRQLNRWQLLEPCRVYRMRLLDGLGMRLFNGLGNNHALFSCRSGSADDCERCRHERRGNKRQKLHYPTTITPEPINYRVLYTVRTG
jgi:hypothetical protein